MPGRDRAKRMAREIWPPDGLPPPTMSTPEALRKLGDELQERGIAVTHHEPTLRKGDIPFVHLDTLRRAIGRR